MATTVTTTQQASMSPTLTGACQVGFSALTGALAGYAFSLISPLGGAIFGATSALSHLIGDAAAEHFGANNTAVKTAIYGASLIISLGAGIFAATTLGFPITVLGAIGLTLAMAATSCFIKCLAIGGLCCGAAGIAGLTAATSRP